MNLLLATFEINFATIVMLVLGFVLGILTMLLIYLSMIKENVKKRKVNIKEYKSKLTQDDLQKMVDEKLDLFKNNKKRKEKGGCLKYTKELSIEIWQEIAKKFYPKSKHPCFELTADEILLLATSVINRLDALLDKPLFKNMKNLRASLILNIIDIKNAIYDIPVVKDVLISEEIKGMAKVLLNAYKIANIANPTTWVTTGISKVANYSFKYMCMLCIIYVAEEAYNIYSKKLFSEEKRARLGEENIIKDFAKNFASFAQEDLKEIIA